MGALSVVKPDTAEKIIYRREGEVTLALRDHYPSKEYAVIPQVRNASGFNATRTADAIVVSLWPSRGLSITGVEIKVSRSDWKGELKNPEKADEVARFCDFWVLAVGDEKIVEEGELPLNWGLLVPGKKPGTLRMKLQPKRLEPVALSRNFVASVLKRAADYENPLKQVEHEIDRRVKEKLDIFKADWVERLEKDHDVAKLKAENDKLRAASDAFKEATGVWMRPDDIEQYRRFGKVIKLLQYRNLGDTLGGIETCLREAANDFRDIQAALPPEARS